MPTVANLSVSVTARTQRFERGMKRSARSLQQFERKTQAVKLALKGLATRMLAIGGIGGAAFLVVRGFSRLVRSTEEFNQAMRGSLAIMGDVSTAMRRDLVNAAVEAARTTKFAAKEIASSYFFLASAGLSAVQSIKALPLVTKFAQAGLFDLSRATDLLTDAQSALGQTSDDATINLQKMTRIADVLVKANTLANASVEQFSEALTNKAGAALKILNKDIEEGVALLAAFADQGIKGANAGTAMDIVLRELRIKAIGNEKAFRDLNVRVFDLSDNMRNISLVIKDLEDALDGMSDKQKTATLLQLGFTSKSVSFIQTVIGMSTKIRDFEKALFDAGGMTAEVGAKQLTPLQKGMAELGATFIDVGRDIGFVTTALGGLAKGLSAVINFVRAGGVAGVLGRGAVTKLRGATGLGGEELLEANKRLQLLQDRLATSNEALQRRRKLAAERAEKQFERDAEQRRINRARGRLVRQPGGGIALEAPRVLQTQKAFDAAIESGKRLNAENVKRRAAVERLTSSLEDQELALSGTGREVDLYKAQLNNATKSQLNYINSIHDSIDALNQQKDAEAKVQKANAERIREQERARSTNFLEASLSRTSFGGANRGTTSKQQVFDPAMLAEAKKQTALLRRSTVPVAG